MREKSKFTSSYRYSPLDPRNWSVLRIITISLSILLIIDWIIGFSTPILLIHIPFIARFFPDNFFILRFFPLFAIIGIILISLLQTKEFLDTPFYSAVLIKVLLYLGSCQYTIIGQIAESALSIICTGVIITILVFNIICETYEPISYEKMMYIGLFLLSIDFIVNFVFFGWRIIEIWGLIYILAVIAGIFLIRLKRVLIGAILIFIMAVLNDYILPVGLSGFDAGAELIKFISLFLIIHPITSIND